MGRVSVGALAPATVIGCVALLAIGGGYAVASSETSGTVKACVQKRSHALYRAPCHRGDAKLNWGQVGPMGAPGVKGDTGSTGNTGPAGIGPAYEAVRASGPSGVLHGAQSFPPSPLTTVATLAIPAAGSYDIRGTTNINETGNGYSVGCVLTAGSDTDTGEAQVNTVWDAGMTVATQVLHVFSAPGSVTLACGMEGAASTDTWSARATSIIATQVSSATVTQVTG